jgi:flotillin
MDTAIIVGVGALVVLLLIIWLSVALYRKVGPNEALIVFGRGGTQVAVGGGRIVWPFIQEAKTLSLELKSFDVAPQQDYYTKQGVAVSVEAVCQIKVKNDPVSIRTAAEQFLNKNAQEQENFIRLVMEGHLRGIVGQLTVEQIVKEPEMVADRMRANSTEDLSKMGLEAVSFTIREVKDKNDYIANMGRPDVERIKRDADIATAEAMRDTEMRRAETMREASVARAEADQVRVIAETASQTRQAEARRDLELKQAEYTTSTQREKAIADKSYDIQTLIMEQQATAEKVKVERVRKEEEAKVQDAEIIRREKELTATVQKLAEAERRRVETIAEADRQRRVLEATAQAEALRLQGQAEAEVAIARGKGEAEAIRLRGIAEAEIIRAKGEAEAASMKLKAASYNEYNQAALLDKLLGSLPELARAMSEPLSKVDKITIVSTGENGGGFGANQITADMAKMIAQAPALIESLTGMKMSDLMQQIPALKAAMQNGHSTTSGTEITKTTVPAVSPEDTSSN